MYQVLYSKFSNERSPRFSICTQVIADENGQRYIYKYPATGEAAAHVERLSSIEEQLATQYQGSRFVPNAMLDLEGKKVFQFVHGKSLEELADANLFAGDLEGFWRLWDAYATEVKKVAGGVTNLDLILQNIIIEITQGNCDATADDAAKESETAAVRKDAAKGSDVSSIVDALLHKKNPWVVIDYEWTYDVAVEPDFILYRAMLYYLNGKEARQDRLPMTDAFARLGFDANTLQEYEGMEQLFQQHIDGGWTKLADFKHYHNRVCVKANEMFEILEKKDEEIAFLQKQLAAFEAAEAVKHQQIAAVQDNTPLRYTGKVVGKLIHGNPVYGLRHAMPAPEMGLEYFIEDVSVKAATAMMASDTATENDAVITDVAVASDAVTTDAITTDAAVADDATSSKNKTIVVRGWTFQRDGLAVSLGLLDQAGQPLETSYDIVSRQDVDAVFGLAPGSAKGFVLSATLPAESIAAAMSTPAVTERKADNQQAEGAVIAQISLETPYGYVILPLHEK